MATDTLPDDAQDRLTTDMDPDDWQDIAESELVDIAESPLTDKIGFVFEHPEIGLHGFEWQPDSLHMRAVKFSETGDSSNGGNNE